MNQRAKRRVYEIMWRTQPREKTTVVVSLFSLLLATAVVLIAIMSTVPDFNISGRAFVQLFVPLSLVVFTIEYVLRLWACTVDPEFHDRIRGRIRFIFTGWSILTLLLIVPLWTAVALHVESQVILTLFLLVLLRLFIGSGSLAVLLQVISVKRSDLALALLIDITILITASSLMWWIESPVNPNIPSIPAAIYWGTATLMTVGYGDVVPITPLGRALAVVVMFAGIATFALPIAIIGSGFLEVREQKQSYLHRYRVVEGHPVLDRLDKLSEHRERGTLTEEEFQSMKKDLLRKNDMEPESKEKKEEHGEQS